MAIDLDDVVKVGYLARLPVDPDSPQAADLVRRLGAVIDYFDQLSTCEADPEPEPTGDEMLGAGEDVVALGLDRDRFAANAPQARDGFLVVPQVKASP